MCYSHHRSLLLIRLKSLGSGIMCNLLTNLYIHNKYDINDQNTKFLSNN